MSDLFETEPEFEIALEAALEGRLQQLVVRDSKDGIEGLRYLKTKAAGRCGFIPMGPTPSFSGIYTRSGKGCG